MRKTITAAFMAAATTAAVGGAGIAAASTHPGGTTGTEHFQLMNTLPAGTTASVIAYGVFTAAAVAHELPNNVQNFVFPNGTIRVRHSNPIGPQALNPKTCLLTASLHGTYRILRGTGQYAGISGHGTYQFSILSLGARSGGKCSQSKLPAALHQVVNASGPVSLP
jgi:hypothetical protein